MGRRDGRRARRKKMKTRHGGRFSRGLLFDRHKCSINGQHHHKDNHNTFIYVDIYIYNFLKTNTLYYYTHKAAHMAKYKLSTGSDVLKLMSRTLPLQVPPEGLCSLLMSCYIISG